MKSIFFIHLCILYLIRLSTPLLAQETSIAQGVIVNKKTLEPLPYAHLQLENGAMGTVANQEGEFSFPIRDAYRNDSLLVSSMGFVSLVIAVNKLMSMDTLFLEESAMLLDPILISSLSAEDIIKKSIAAIPKNYASSAYHASGYFRSASKECGTFVQLLESPVTLTDPGYLSKDSASVSYLEMNKSQDYSLYHLDENHLLEDALGFENIRLRNSFLNLSTLDSWHFDLSDYTKYNGMGVFVISASYISDKRKMDHSANIFIDEDNYAIYKIDYNYHWYDQYYVKTAIDSLVEAEHEWEGAFHYAKSSDKYYLKYFVFHHTKSVYDDFYKKKICDLEVYSEFNTQQIAYSGDSLLYELNIRPVATDLYQRVLEDLDSLQMTDIQEVK